MALTTRMLVQYALPVLLVSGGSAHATCFREASDRYHVPVALLRAVATVESSNRARVVARNTNGSLDYGFMQINSTWLPTLSRYGIGEDELMDPCTSLKVGGWILAQNIRQLGYNWQAVGAYGAGTAKDKAAARQTYARKVFRALDRQVAAEVGGGQVAGRKGPDGRGAAGRGRDAGAVVPVGRKAVAVRHTGGILVVDLGG